MRLAECCRAARVKAEVIVAMRWAVAEVVCSPFAKQPLMAPMWTA